MKIPWATTNTLGQLSRVVPRAFSMMGSMNWAMLPARASRDGISFDYRQRIERTAGTYACSALSLTSPKDSPSGNLNVLPGCL